MSITVIPDPADNFAQNFLQGANLTLQHQESQMRQKATATEIALKQMQMQHEEQKMPLLMAGLQTNLEQQQAQLAQTLQASQFAKEREPYNLGILKGHMKMQESQLKGQDLQNDLQELLKQFRPEERSAAKAMADLTIFNTMKEIVDKSSPEHLEWMKKNYEKDSNPIYRNLATFAGAKMEGDEYFQAKALSTFLKSNPEVEAAVVGEAAKTLMSGGVTGVQRFVAMTGLAARAEKDPLTGQWEIPPLPEGLSTILAPELQDKIKNEIIRVRTGKSPQESKGQATPKGTSPVNPLLEQYKPVGQSLAGIRTELEAASSLVTAYKEAESSVRGNTRLYSSGPMIHSTAGNVTSQRASKQLEAVTTEIDLLNPQNAMTSEMWKARGFSSNEAKQKADNFLLTARAANPGEKGKMLQESLLKDKSWMAPLAEMTVEQKVFYNNLLRTALLEPNKASFLEALYTLDLRKRLPPSAVVKIAELQDLLK